MAALDLLLLLVVGALWGASFLFIRQGAPVLGPVGLIEARVALAGLCLLVVVVLAGRLPELRRDPAGFLVLAALSAGVPFTLIAAAELHLTASLAAILNATTPLFSLLVSAALARRLPSPAQFAGVLAGLAGVIALVGFGPLRPDTTLALSVAASLSAALLYALGGMYAKVRFPRTHPLVTAAGQQLGSAVLLLPLLPLVPPRRAPDGPVLGAVAVLAFACTALASVLFFWLLRRIGPTGALTVTFLVPLFGLLWGALFLGEEAGWSTLAGLALILGAVFLVAERRAPERSPVDG